MYTFCSLFAICSFRGCVSCSRRRVEPGHDDAEAAPGLIPGPEFAIMLRAPRPLRGAFMRRREAGRGAVPAGLVAYQDTRAAPELLPGPLGVPARSWLKARSARRARRTGLKRGPLPTRLRAWRAARRPSHPRRMRTLQVCVFRRAIPLPSRGDPGETFPRARSCHARAGGHPVITGLATKLRSAVTGSPGQAGR